MFNAIFQGIFCSVNLIKGGVFCKQWATLVFEFVKRGRNFKSLTRGMEKGVRNFLGWINNGGHYVYIFDLIPVF